MITWNPDQTICQLGFFALRWYSLLWVIGLAASYFVVYKLYQRQRIPEKLFDPLFFYCFVGILIGARLGHCLFYDFAYFQHHLLEIFLPMRQDGLGGWHFTGFAGLASHGGTVGLIVALLLYVRKTKLSFMRTLDNIAMATPLTAGCIRLGNLMNSEIVGKYTNADYGFVFARLNETAPRHPAQLYEAVFYFLLFPLGMWYYRSRPHHVGNGRIFGMILTLIFTFRLLVEILKEVQEPWELAMQASIGLNQGQLLSIPFILIGMYCWRGGKFTQKWGDTDLGS